MQSCIDCPSYIPQDRSNEAASRFKRPAGGAMCGRFGHVLSNTRSTENEAAAIANHFAMQCEAHGEPMPDEPVEVYARVAAATLVNVPEPDESVRTCKNCRHSVDEQAVYSELGWALPLCSVKGNLIFRPLNEARECPFREGGDQITTTVNVEILPYYKKGFRISDDIAIKAYVAVNGDDHPTEYPTDKEVSEEENEAGIRAWRKVQDHESGKFTYAPIFKDDAFTEEQRLLIPGRGDDTSHPELYIDYSDILFSLFVECLELHETPVLTGAPGTGKTQAGRYAAYLCNMPFRIIQFSGEMDPAEFLGATGYSPERGTFFEPGIMPLAWTSVGWLCEDEPNLGPDSCTQVLRPAHDNVKSLVIEGHHFPKNPYCFPYLAMNPSWDMRNLGTQEMADADTNRLSFLEIRLPPEPVERQIIRSYCKTLDNYDISDDVLDKIMSIAVDIREAAEQGTYPASWGTRQQIKVARKTKWYGLQRAYDLAALNNMAPEVREQINIFISTY